MININNAKSFDFHCHVDLYPDPPKIIQKCEEDMAFTLAVTTTPKAWKQNCEWTKNCKYVQPALGLHPELVGERFDELDLLVKYLPEAKFIGETGLDGGSRYKTSFELQKKVFSKILDVVYSFSEKRVLSIHSREAAKDVINTLSLYAHQTNVLYILHWFTGTISEVEKALELNCYFSINHKMINSEKGRALVKRIPLNRILTETDGPFTSTSNKIIYPTDTINFSKSIASIKSMSPEEVFLAIRKNALYILQ
jgi:TatD DNase family protein